MDEQRLVQVVGIITQINDIAESGADGHDEINEHTPEAYIDLLEGQMNHIRELCREGWALFPYYILHAE